MEDSSQHDSELPVFLGQKVRYCYTNRFLFHFQVFSDFLSKLGPFKSAICLFDDFKGERLPHAQRKREMGRKRYVSWLDITNPYFFFWFCVNRSCLMRVFPQTFFFTQYAAPSTEAFVWPSFHFHNFTQRFFLFWLAQLAERRSAGREVAGSNPD